LNISSRRSSSLAGAVDGDLHHEAVARGGGQLEGLFALEPVAVGEHRHVREAELAVEGRHAALGHRAQQQRLHLRARPVDLVEEEDGERFAVPQQGPGLDAGLPSALDVGVVDEVVGHQVDRALDALEVAADGAREGPQHGGLADADVAFAAARGRARTRRR
jgi:hypothetical protein